MSYSMRKVTESYLSTCSLSQSEEASIDDLMELVQQIVAFHMKVNS